MAESITNPPPDPAPDPVLQTLQDAVLGCLLILDSDRRICLLNEEARQTLKTVGNGNFLGRKLGDAFGCVYSRGGCGVSERCVPCVIHEAIDKCLRNRSASEGDCEILVAKNGSSDSRHFRFRVSPISRDNGEFAAFVFSDRSPESGLDVLERAFFHDITSTVTAILGWSGIISRRGNLSPGEGFQKIHHLARKLARELSGQRRLVQFAKGQGRIQLKMVCVNRLFADLRETFENRARNERKRIVFEHTRKGDKVLSDRFLLGRVLSNMVKNAIEAAESGQEIRIGYDKDGESPVLWVHNPGIIPDDIVPHVFQPNFSTMGAAKRGIGTYTMKLFCEKYLGSKVRFKTDETTGTIFSIFLPH